MSLLKECTDHTPGSQRQLSQISIWSLCKFVSITIWIQLCKWTPQPFANRCLEGIDLQFWWKIWGVFVTCTPDLLLWHICKLDITETDKTLTKYSSLPAAKVVIFDNFQRSLWRKSRQHYFNSISVFGEPDVTMLYYKAVRWRALIACGCGLWYVENKVIFNNHMFILFLINLIHISIRLLR